MELSRYQGCLLGLACGDAVGTSVEFSSRDSFPPLDDMIGGGPFNLRAGQWTDDTSMALCLAESLVQRGGFDATDQMNRYCNWANYGYMSSTGECFDIGITIRAALDRYLHDHNPFAGSCDPKTAGNGAIMRLAPVPMFYAASLDKTLHFSAESCRTTHGAEESIECARLFGAQIRKALQGANRDEILFDAGYRPASDKVRAVAEGAYKEKDRTHIQGTGYVVESLEAALWCFYRTENYRDAVLMAANLGDDADTTAAIVGQLAGAFYGVTSIPDHWRAQLAMRDEITALADRLLGLREQI